MFSPASSVPTQRHFSAVIGFATLLTMTASCRSQGEMAAVTRLAVQMFPSKAVCASPCSLIVLDPRVRSRLTNEFELDPPVIGQLNAHEHGDRLLVRMLNPDQLHGDTVGCWIVWGQSAPDSVSITLQIFRQHQEVGRSWAIATFRSGRWQLTPFRTAWI